MEIQRNQEQTSFDMFMKEMVIDQEPLDLNESSSIEFDEDAQPLTNAKCSLLIHGYTRLVCKTHSIPIYIARSCVAFYSTWLDLKIVYCDRTGDIDLKTHEIISIPIDIYSHLTLKQVYEEMEDNIYSEAVSNEYDRLCKLSQEQLIEYYSLENKRGSKNELIKEVMSHRFGHIPVEFEEISWTDAPGIRKRNPLVHVWLRFKHIKTMYPINTETITLSQELYENEDNDRWVEVPDDYLEKMSLEEMKRTDPNFDCLDLVIERIGVKDWQKGTGTWPRAKSEDWRETMQVGDIVEVKDEQGKFYESIVRYIYPKDHETMSGQCVIHYIGWPNKWDEALDIDSKRIAKRYTNCSGPHRPESYKRLRHLNMSRMQLRESKAHLSYFDEFEQSQGDADLQRAIAASLGQV